MPRGLRLIAAARFFPIFLGTALALTSANAGAQTLSDLATASRQTSDALFGSMEFSSNSLDALPQWKRVVSEVRSESAAFAGCVSEPDQCHNSTQRAWREIVTKAATLDHKGKIEAVNRFFNRWPYKLDEELYGLSEYWASPREFMTRSGDCEDFAIAKFFALRQLGFDNESMRIVILWDQIRAIGHAVLAIYEPDGIIILDSLSGFIVPHSRYSHYIPQYSMNETTRWSHIHSEKIPQAWVKRN